MTVSGEQVGYMEVGGDLIGGIEEKLVLGRGYHEVFKNVVCRMIKIKYMIMDK